MRFWFALLGLLVGLYVALNAFAQDAKCPASGSKASCQSKDATATAGCQSAGESAACCTKRAAEVAVMPVIKYQVGEKQLCCEKMAAEEAGKSNAKVRYVVAEKTYDDIGEAMDAYAVVLDSHYKNLLTMHYAVGEESLDCPASAEEAAKKAGKAVQYQLASYRFSDKAKADAAAKAAEEASAKVEMKMVVGDQAYQCPESAKDAASKCGKSVEYVVGESKTCCPKAAKVEVAKARIHAALEVLEKAAKA